MLSIALVLFLGMLGVLLAILPIVLVTVKTEEWLETKKMSYLWIIFILLTEVCAMISIELATFICLTEQLSFL